MKKRVATQVEVIAMSRLLDQHLEKDGEYVKYKDDWSDERVAKHVHETLKSDHAKTVRLGSHGIFRPSSTAAVASARVEQLEADLAALTKAHSDLVTRFNGLCNGLTVARVIDARHLSKGN